VTPPDVTVELLQEIQAAALDPNRPVTEALRLCMAAGGKLGSVELRDWARRELQGYKTEDELPEYRQLSAVLLMDYFNGAMTATGQQVTPWMLDEDAREYMHRFPVRWSIAEVEDAATGTKESLRFTSEGSGYFAAMITRNEPNNTFLRVHAVYWTVARSLFVGVVDQVRTRLVEFVSEFDIAVTKQGARPGAAAAHALSVVMGDGNMVMLTTAGGDVSNSATSSAPAMSPPRWWERGWWTVWRTVGATAVGVATIVGTLIAAGML